MVPIVLFAISLVALVAFFAVKYFEGRRKRVFFATKRKALDEKVLQEFRRRRIEMPKIDLDGILHFLHDVMHGVAIGVHRVFRMAERHSARAVNVIQGRRDTIERRATSSEFLKNVARHKHNLKRPERTLPE